jgi:hypothetical protein
VRYEPEEPLEIDGAVYRSIWGQGTEEEIDRLLEVDAPAKGWELHRRERGRVLLIKASPVDESEAVPVVVAAPQTAETDEEWLARTSGVVVPDGKVICARCAYVDRSLQMHGCVKCGTTKSRSNLLTKHSWVSPTYPRVCPDYAASDPPPRTCK